VALVPPLAHRQPRSHIKQRPTKNKQTSSVHIKATRAGPAVLCTADATDELKTVETTNALLLVPEGEVSRHRVLKRKKKRIQRPGAPAGNQPGVAAGGN